MKTRIEPTAHSKRRGYGLAIDRNETSHWWECTDLTRAELLQIRDAITAWETESVGSPYFSKGRIAEICVTALKASGLPVESIESEGSYSGLPPAIVVYLPNVTRGGGSIQFAVEDAE